MKRILLMGALAALIVTVVAPLVNPPISNDSPRAGATPAAAPGGSVVLAEGAPIPPCAPCGCSCRQNQPDVQAVRPATEPRLG